MVSSSVVFQIGRIPLQGYQCKWWLRGSCDSKSKNWLGEVQGMWRVAELKKVLAEGERNGLSELCKSGDVIWE